MKVLLLQQVTIKIAYKDIYTIVKMISLFLANKFINHIIILSAFRDRGVPEPTSECRRVPQPRWVKREGEREGGKARRPWTGVREVGIPRPSCSSRAQVGCACSRGLQASTRERERATSRERLSPSSSPRGQPSVRGPWSFLL